MKNRPILIVEDDQDDQFIITGVFGDLAYENEVLFFNNAMAAYEHLSGTTDWPLVIISDMKLPGMNGLEFKKLINKNEELYKKCIPFVLFSTDIEDRYIEEAYSESINGFFTKPFNYDGFAKVFKNIVEY